MACGNFIGPLDRRTRVLYLNPIIVFFLVGYALFGDAHPVHKLVALGAAFSFAAETVVEHGLVCGERLRDALWGA